MEEEQKRMILPPGFQFDPTDEELIAYFLCRRVSSMPCYPDIIPDVDIYDSMPWELKDKALSSHRGWYFFSRMKQNRSTEKGFWKELGFTTPILTSNGNIEIGTKHFLVFDFNSDDVVGSSSEIRTNWIMQEYHVIKRDPHAEEADEWVLCLVHEAVDMAASEVGDHPNRNDGIELSDLDEVFFSMEDDQQEITFPGYNSTIY